LSPDQAARRLQLYGKNHISPLPHRWLLQILGYFFQGFGAVLLLGCVLVFISWKPLGEPPALANLALAIVLLAVFFIQAAFNAWQDWSSSRVMASITAMLPEACRVRRNGHAILLNASDIVPGDIVELSAGNKLPADVRFVDVSFDASFDRSVLTGCSHSKYLSFRYPSPPLSSTSTVLPGKRNLMLIIPFRRIAPCQWHSRLDRRQLPGNALHWSPGHPLRVRPRRRRRRRHRRHHCLWSYRPSHERATHGADTAGKGDPAFRPAHRRHHVDHDRRRHYCLVSRILLQTNRNNHTNPSRATWLRADHPNWINVPTLIVDCVSVAIAFMPVGLPVALTASLTITANLMRRNKILCKSLKTVETLGAVSVICSDKTGTLTKVDSPFVPVAFIVLIFVLLQVIVY
jgi:hypothetical protein